MNSIFRHINNAKNDILKVIIAICIIGFEARTYAHTIISSQSIGASVTVGYGASGSASYSQANAKSDYKSVNEQSAIKTKDGGFDIKVAGNTNLKGAVIESSDKAITDNKNSLTTATLTTSDISNKAEYSASSVSMGISGGGGTMAGMGGYADDKGDASSTTKSAISKSNINITNEDKQKALTGKDAKDTVASINTDTKNAHTKLEKIFDKDEVEGKVQASAEIIKTFSSVAPKAIGDYSKNKVDELTVQANKEQDPTRKQELLNEAAKWDEGGTYRVALHTAAGGLSGGFAGAASNFTVSASAKELDKLQTKTAESLINSGMNETAAKAIASAVSTGVASGIGAIAGGATNANGGAITGALSGGTTDMNNRQLHNKEIMWIKAKAKEYAGQKYGTNNPTSSQVAEAEASLAQQAMRQTDKAWSLELGSATDKSAQAFLQRAGGDMFTVKNLYEFTNGNTNGVQSVSSLSASQYQQLKNFTLVNASTATTFNPSGSQNVLNAYKTDVNGKIDAAKNGMSWSAVNDWLRNFVPNTVQAVKETPQMVNSAENWVANVAPTTTQDRMNDLYGQGGAQVQANLATADVINTAGMLLGGGAVVKGALKDITASAGKGVASTTIKDVKAISAADANAPFIKEGQYAPYDTSTQVRQFTTTATIENQFVRVYTDGKTSAAGNWIVRADEIAGMTPTQIQQYLALPNIPSSIVDVTIPANTKMQVGKVAAQPEFGVSKAGGTQYQLLQKIPGSSFHNVRSLK